MTRTNVREAHFQGFVLGLLTGAGVAILTILLTLWTAGVRMTLS